MRYLRLRIILLALWLTALFSAEHLIKIINIDVTTYLLIFAVIFVVLILPRLSKIAFGLILVIPMALLLVHKSLTGQPLLTTQVIIEEFTLAITILLSRVVNFTLYDFESAVAKITIGRRDRLPESESVGQGYLYREVRRARNFQRPLSLMAIAVNEKSIKPNLNRLVQEVQLSMMKQYMMAGVSRVLCNQLDDCAVIVQAEDHFLIAMPETRPEEIVYIKDRISKSVSESMGINVSIGTASLAKDSYTFEGLINKATDEMNMNIMVAEPETETSSLPVENSVTVAK